MSAHDHGLANHPGLPWGFAIALVALFFIYLFSPFKLTFLDTRPPVEFACPDKAISCIVEYRDAKGKNRRSHFTCFRADNGRCDVDDMPLSP